eukprot:360973-Chlamydomonas_euryale.AAC.10
MADDSPRALMIAAPRCCTVEMNSPSSHASSDTASRMGLSTTVPWLTSGYWVLEWLPQMMTFFTCVTGTPTRSATCASALLWSRRVIHVMSAGGMLGACSLRMSALVLAGFATTSTWHAHTEQRRG